MPDLASLAPWVALGVSISTVIFSLFNARQKAYELAQRDRELQMKADDAYVEGLRERIEFLEEEKARYEAKVKLLEDTIAQQEREIARLWRMVIQGPSPGNPVP